MSEIQQEYRTYILPGEVQKLNQGMFMPRKPLRLTARRAGWQGFTYNTELVWANFVKAHGGPISNLLL